MAERETEGYCEEQDQGEGGDDSVKQRRPRRRKCKNLLVQLHEAFPGVVFQLAAQYGTPADQMYVMDVAVDGQVKCCQCT